MTLKKFIIGSIFLIIDIIGISICLSCYLIQKSNMNHLQELRFEIIDYTFTDMLNEWIDKASSENVAIEELYADAVQEVDSAIALDRILLLQIRICHVAMLISVFVMVIIVFSNVYFITMLLAFK